MTEKNWINGEYYVGDVKRVSVFLNTIHYGSSAFEGIMCIDGKQTAIFRLHEHIDRFFSSAEVLGFKLPYSREEFYNIVKKVIKINGCGSYYLRPIVFRNCEYFDLIAKRDRLFIAILCKRFNLIGFLFQMRMNIKVMVSNKVKNMWGGYLAGVKLSGKYLVSAIAKLEADRNGFNDAILLDCHNMISEATAANIFIIKDSIIKTPFLNNSLKGITQNSIMRIACGLGYKVIEADIDLDQLYNADEVFLTSTARGLISISQVDKYKIANKTKIAATLRAEYVNIINGSNHEYVEWLTPIEVK